MQRKIYGLIAGMLILLLLVTAGLVPMMGCKPKAEEPVKIAFITSLTGPVAETAGGINRPAELAVKQINDAGGILGGRKVELLKYDDKINPAEAVSAANKAIYRDKVVAVTGFCDASLTLSVMPLVLKAELPLLNVMSEDESFTNRPGEYGVLNTQTTTKGTVACEAKAIETVFKQPVKTVVAIGPETPFLHNYFREIKAYWDRPGAKVKVLDYISYPMGSPDVTTPYLKAIGYNPDVIWSIDWVEPSLIQSFKIMKEVGWKGQIMGVHQLLDATLVAHAGPLIEGYYCLSDSFLEMADPASVGYNPQLAAYAKAEAEMFPGQRASGGLGMKSYIGFKMLLMAMDKAGTTSDLKKIHQAYNKLDWVSPHGHKVEVEENGLFVWKNMYLAQVRNGEIVVIKELPYKSYSEAFTPGMK